MANWEEIRTHINTVWDDSIVPTLSEYIKIPNQSPAFDPEWASNGLIDKAMDLLVDWVKKQPVAGMKLTLDKEEGKTPFLVIEIDGTEPTAQTVLLYGHMDKQPPMLPWADGLDPYQPVIRDGKLYGRGGADDGYSVCAAILSILALQKAKVPHARCCITIEACEESGSDDLPYYVDKYAKTLGEIDLIVCLDSGALNYDQFWITFSLRGVIGGTLKIETVHEAVHSGIGGGVCVDPNRIFRHLMDRIEDVKTGQVLIKEAHCEIPQHVVDAVQVLNSLGDEFIKQYPLHEGVSAQEHKDNADLGLNNWWRPCVTVIGQDGLPGTKRAGNVIRTAATYKISIRTPPTVDADAVSLVVKRILEENPPYGAKVHFSPDHAGSGWSAPAVEPWLAAAMNEGSQAVFNKGFGSTALGGSIPFMGMLGHKYPKAQFVVCGVLGPESNAHGPNEFLHIPFAKGVTYVVSRVLAAHFLKLK